MHIPDGFLATYTWAPAWAVSAGGIGFCLRKTSAALKERMVPMMGVMSAFIFAAQMINFPVFGGTSGHLFGGVLASALLGPYPGAVVIACVLVFQCLVFQDGGLLALGANVFNMALAGTLGGYSIFVIVRKLIPAKGTARFPGLLTGVGAAAWGSVVIAAVLCAFELALSGTSPLGLVLPAMAGIHAIIGIGEALITVSIVGFLAKVRPDLVFILRGKEAR